MADSYTSRLRLRKIEPPASGDVWGANLNEDVIDIVDASIDGELSISIGSSTSYSLAALVDGTLSNSHYYSLIFTGTPASAVTITIPASVTRKKFQIKNSTGQRATVKYTASTGVVLGNGDVTIVWCDGSEVYDRGPGHRITAAEIAAGVTPVNYAIPSHDFTGTVIPDRYGTNTTPGTTSMQTALGAALLVMYQSGCPIELLGTTYLGTLSIRHNNCGIFGPGESVCTLKNPAGALSLGGVLEVGDAAAGNSATEYDGFFAHGFTIDGNLTNATAPTDDLKGHGLAMTKITNWNINIKAKDCHNSGIGIFINSNYGKIDASVENCGNVTYTQPGFDINSSKYITGNVVSKNCYVGARSLDNCWGNNISFSVHNTDTQGFIYQNQTANVSDTNNYNIAVYSAGSVGVLIQEKCYGGILNISVNGAGTVGCYVVDGSSAANTPSDMVLNVTTTNCQQQGLLHYGNRCIINHTSRLDGRGGAAGTYYAADINGDANTINSKVFDSGTPQVRSLAIRAAASDNVIQSAWTEGTVSGLLDSGTRTTLPVVTLSGSETYDPPSLVDGAGATSTGATITGAALGDFVIASWASDLQGVTLTGYVSAADTVKCRIQNESGGTLDFGSTVIKYRVIKQ